MLCSLLLHRGPTDDPNSVSRGHADAPMRVIGDSASPPWTDGQNDEPCGTADHKNWRIPGKNQQKNKVAAARLEPWPIIFCSIPHLFESGRKKGTASAPCRTRMQVGIKRIRYPGRKSRIAISRAICNFFIMKSSYPIISRTRPKTQSTI
jgi:hypothetical protein